MQDQDRNINISTSTIVRTIAFVALAAALYYMKDVVLIVLTAIVISSAIEPGVNWFEKRKLPRLLGIVTIYLFSLLVVAIFFLSVIPIFLGDLSSLVANIPMYINQISNYLPVLDESILQGYVPLLQSLASTINNAAAYDSFFSPSTFIANVPAIVNTTLDGILIFVLSFYFSVTKNGVDYFLRIITPQKHETYVIDLWRRTKVKIGGWLQGQLILGLLMGIMIYVALAILGVKHAFLLGLTAALFELIPVFGPTLSAIPGILLTLLDKGVVLALIVLGVYVIAQQFENHLLYPAVVRKIVGISPLVVILALAIGLELAGLLGLILAVPASVLIVEFINDMDRKRPMSK